MLKQRLVDDSRTSTSEPVVVVSGVNLTEMGGLSVLTDCLNQLRRRSAEYTIVALVHKKDLVGVPGIVYYEFPRSKRSIFDRLYHEYWIFWKLSRQLKPFLWLSLHNTTPRVRAKRRAVYCHNVSNFHDLSWREALIQPRFAILKYFLDLMYRINLHHNTTVIVQQNWIRQAFRRRFKVDNIVVAHPVFSEAQTSSSRQRDRALPFTFFYPSHPSIHKNFEVVCAAAMHLVADGITDFEIWLTFTALDNRYTKQISKLCAGLPQIRLLGRLPREKVFQRYALTDCLLFPSKLETWGLAISEFRPYNRPIIVADAVYARETIGDHPCVALFSQDSAEELAERMRDAMHGAKSFVASKAPKIEPPFACSWDALFDILLGAEPLSSGKHHGALTTDSLIRSASKSA